MQQANARACIASGQTAFDSAHGTGQAQPLDAAQARVDIDFSLAMHNRTGKYFIGRDLLENLPELIGDVFYWLLPAAAPPAGLFGKIICKLQGGHVRLNAAGGPLRWRAPPRADRPLLHLEPYTVLARSLRPQDAVVCHDVGPLTHPALFESALYRTYQLIFDDIARVGPHMIFVSQASRIAFEQLFPMASPASSRVIYPALRADVAAVPPQPVPGLDGRFLLTVGAIGTRKNQLRCIAAFARSGLAARGARYVICGSREPGVEAIAEAAAKTEGVVLLPYVSDGELAWLYQNASGFVLASLLEGFGIPLAEAIAHGLVPAVSADSVLWEVAGDGALTVDPLAEESIAAAMTALIDMSADERRARRAMLEQAIARFSLEQFRADWRDALIAMR